MVKNLRGENVIIGAEGPMNMDPCEQLRSKLKEAVERKRADGMPLSRGCKSGNFHCPLEARYSKSFNPR